MRCAEENNMNFSHNVYKNDPLLFKSYIDKKVHVTTVDGNKHTGIVYTVDPVSESLVLVQPVQSDDFDMQIIMGHAIKDIEVLPEPETKIPGLFLLAPTTLSQSALAKRKNAVKQLLLDNMFPVTEVDSLLILEDVVTIRPPYGIQQCECANSTILQRMQDILSNVKH